MSQSNDELLSNIKRQAKRLSKSINVPLRQAQGHLAMSVYQCDNWNHLRDSLKSDSFDNQLLLLSALQPNSDTFLYTLLNENLSNISLSIKENTSINIPENDLEELIINIFGIDIIVFKEKSIQ
ncbi:MAG: hypothetical protein ACI9YH_003210 [Colwellia sp.]|jgi:hypothetical protein